MTKTPAAPKQASWAYAETFASEGESLRQARAAAKELGCAAVSPGVVSALTILARAVDAKAVVEIGTGTGVSGLGLFHGMNGSGVLTSIDLETEQQIEARKAFRVEEIANQRFRLINGRALDVLPNLRDGAYDLVFIDGDKLEYVEYVAQAMRLLRSGGLIVINDALGSDGVADPSNEDDETVIIREALEAVKEDETLTASLLPVGGGLLVAVKS